ncbi:hypothetical protein [Actinokineospora inagensis]|uniref:hypothetical protein n=1 Tax=Actinokineospora inagensis TaxID=103730 RepID=UPI0003FC3453|nr:hypothetical protein [Actinokineospora inagensis]
MLNPRVDVYADINTTGDCTHELVSTETATLVFDGSLHLTFTRDGLHRLITEAGEAVAKLDATRTPAPAV